MQKLIQTFVRLSILGIFFGVFSQNSLAQETWALKPDHNQQHPEHQIEFSYQATEALENDLMVIRFAAIAEGENSAEVSVKINRMMQQAKRQLQNIPLDTVQTSDYTVSPIYDKNRVINHWRGQQTLSISAKTDQNIDQTLQQLQSYLAYQSMQFTLSAKTRIAAEEQLLNTALMGYQRKAEQIAKGFGKTTFTLLKTTIQPNFRETPPLYRSAPMMMEAQVASSAPYQAQGKTEISVQLHGVLVLRP